MDLENKIKRVNILINFVRILLDIICCLIFSLSVDSFCIIFNLKPNIIFIVGFFCYPIINNIHKIIYKLIPLIPTIEEKK